MKKKPKNVSELKESARKETNRPWTNNSHIKTRKENFGTLCVQYLVIVVAFILSHNVFGKSDMKCASFVEKKTNGKHKKLLT